jgi:predicted ester cyclase
MLCAMYGILATNLSAAAYSIESPTARLSERISVRASKGGRSSWCLEIRHRWEGEEAVAIIFNIYGYGGGQDGGVGGGADAGGRVARNKRTAREAVEEIWNNRNIDAVDRYTAPMARGRQAGEGMGPEDLKVALEEMFAAFPDAYMELELQVAEGDYVVNFCKLTGTHQGDFRGIPATGNRIEVRGFSRLHYGPDGKVDDEYVDFDQRAMLEQIGALQRAASPDVAPREVARQRMRNRAGRGGGGGGTGEPGGGTH